MTRFYRTALVGAALTVLLTGQAWATTVGYWQFNEQAPGVQTTGAAGELIDSSGSGHPGYAYGTVLPSYSAAIKNPPSALTLGASGSLDDYAVVPNSSDFNLMLGDGGHDYTIEAVIKLPSNPSDPNYVPLIMSKRGDVGSGWVFGGFRDGKARLYVEGTGLNFLNPGVSGNTVITDDQWHHVAVAIDNNPTSNLTSATFYLDGVADGTSTFESKVYAPAGGGNHWANENIVNTADVGIGWGSDFSPNAHFRGAIDAVAFSNTLLGPGSFVIHSVPEPSTLCLLASALIGLLAYAWRKRR